MKSQTGARYVRKQRQELRDKEPVCIKHYQSDAPFVRVSDNVIKRPRVLRRKAD